MPAPSVFTVMRHILSRAFRETGQALDRAGLRGVVHAKQGRRMGTDDPYKFNDHFSRHRQMMGLLRRGQPTLPGLTAGNYTNENQIGDEKNQSVAFLAPCATLIGNVHLAPNTSIFYKALLKADVAAHGINLIQSAEEEEGGRTCLWADTSARRTLESLILLGALAIRPSEELMAEEFTLAKDPIFRMVAL